MCNCGSRKIRKTNTRIRYKRDAKSAELLHDKILNNKANKINTKNKEIKFI